MQTESVIPEMLLDPKRQPLISGMKGTSVVDA